MPGATLSCPGAVPALLPIPRFVAAGFAPICSRLFQSPLDGSFAHKVADISVHPGSRGRTAALDDPGHRRRSPRRHRNRRCFGRPRAMSPGLADLAREPCRVGVLLPVYSGTDPGHFREAMVSLRAQEGVATRIILGCDGELSPAHERVIEDLTVESDLVLRSDHRSGLSRTLNQTIEAALRDDSIEYLARMDADDISVPHRFCRQSRFLQAHPDISVAGSWCVEFTETGVAGFLKQLPTSDSELRKSMVYRSALAHPSVMFHRRVLEAGFRYDPRYDRTEDYELWSRLLLAGVRIANVPEYLLWHRVSPALHVKRAGWRLGANEVSLRIRYAKAAGLLRPWHYIGLAGFFLVRVAPQPLRKLAYRMRD